MRNPLKVVKESAAERLAIANIREIERKEGKEMAAAAWIQMMTIEICGQVERHPDWEPDKLIAYSDRILETCEYYGLTKADLESMAKVAKE